MAVFGAVVQPLVKAVLDARCNLAFGGGIRSQLVGDEALWRTAVLHHQPHKQAFRRLDVAPTLEYFLQNHSILVDRMPPPDRFV